MQISAYLIRYASFAYLSYFKKQNTKNNVINASYQLMKFHGDIY